MSSLLTGSLGGLLGGQVLAEYERALYHNQAAGGVSPHNHSMGFQDPRGSFVVADPKRAGMSRDTTSRQSVLLHLGFCYDGGTNHYTDKAGSYIISGEEVEDMGSAEFDRFCGQYRGRFSTYAETKPKTNVTLTLKEKLQHETDSWLSDIKL